MPQVQIHLDVWVDYVCPFCYLELPVIDRLKADMGEALRIEWHPFELRPEPSPPLDPDAKYLLETWSKSVHPLAAARGMTLRLPPVQPRSRKAFEAAYFAREHGAFDAMHRALFRAFFEDGRDIGNVEALADIGRGVGLDGDALSEALASGRHRVEVLKEEVVAAAYGVTAVPVITARRIEHGLLEAHALSGAVDYRRVRELIASLPA